MKRFFLSTALLLCLPSANATLITTSPQDICAAGTSSGLVTRGWKNIGVGFGCSSPYKDIGTGDPLANNLAFYATGQSNQATRVKIILNINSKKQSKQATQELVNIARTVLAATTGQALSKRLEQALRNGKNAEEVVGQAKARVVRDNWPTGAGYEVQFIVE